MGLARERIVWISNSLSSHTQRNRSRNSIDLAMPSISQCHRYRNAIDLAMQSTSQCNRSWQCDALSPWSSRSFNSLAFAILSVYHLLIIPSPESLADDFQFSYASPPSSANGKPWSLWSPFNGPLENINNVQHPLAVERSALAKCFFQEL